MALCVEADLVIRAGGADNFLVLFDRDGDGTADADLVAAAIAWAEAELYSILGASHGGTKFDDPGPVPILIKDLAARLAVGYAEDLSLTLRNKKREGQGFKAGAIADLKAIAENDKKQLPSGSPLPFSAGESYVTSSTAVFGDATDPEKGFSGF